jgi:lipopolysaccharide heptosyltransferase II
MAVYRNILVHCLINIGDVVMATSVLALLKKIYPTAKITMMVKPAAAPIVQNNPVVDEVIIFDYTPKKTSLKKMFHFLQLIRSRKFDLSISLDGKSRPAYLTFLAGIPRRVGPSGIFGGKSKALKIFTDVIETPNYLEVHQTQVLQSIVRGFTGFNGTAVPVMARIMPENKAVATKLLAELGPEKIKVALCVKGTFPLKDWPPARFSQLVDKLAGQYDAAFFIIGTPADKVYADTVIAQAATSIANFCGRTSLIDLAALLTASNLFITVDTGAMHIGATTGVPLVALYGCTTPINVAPCSDKATIIAHKFPCNPCHYPAAGCPYKFRCMDSIAVEEVFQAASDKLNTLLINTNND